MWHHMMCVLCFPHPNLNNSVFVLFRFNFKFFRVNFDDFFTITPFFAVFSRTMAVHVNFPLMVVTIFLFATCVMMIYAITKPSWSSSEMPMGWHIPSFLLSTTRRSRRRAFFYMKSSEKEFLCFSKKNCMNNTGSAGFWAFKPHITA